jgi:hypothetical protein
MAWGGPGIVGIVLLIQAMIPPGDVSLIPAAKGSTSGTFGIHGFTAAAAREQLLQHEDRRTAPS